MASASFSLSSPFLSPKFAISSTPPPKCVRFRRQHCVSAAYTTAERSTTASRPNSRIATSTSLYEVLGIQMGATCLEVKTAYRRLARVLHPDVASDGRKDASADEFIRIHAAYSTLSDPEKRADYDRTLIWRRSMSVTPSASVLSGYARRSWETDQCWLYLKECIETIWFDGLINKDVEVTKEIYSLQDSDFDHQDLIAHGAPFRDTKRIAFSLADNGKY